MMMMNQKLTRPDILTSLLSLLLALGLSVAAAAQAVTAQDSLLTDNARNRPIPIATYFPTRTNGNNQHLVILSHGYGQNQGGSYKRYSYLAEHLARHGFYVVSIQHELPTDSLIPAEGIPQIVRRPFWDRGADNINFVIGVLKAGKIFHKITLIGHSNGGDMTALFPQKYPGIVQQIITLDNRRMALPRTASPKILSLRSSDQPADEGVLPTPEEQQQFGIQIIRLANTTHNEMDDSATARQRKEINRYILDFLQAARKG